MGADGEDRLPHAFALAAGDAARLRRPSPFKWFVLILAAGTVGLGLWRAPGLTAGLAIIAVQVAFAV